MYSPGKIERITPRFNHLESPSPKRKIHVMIKDPKFQFMTEEKNPEK